MMILISLMKPMKKNLILWEESEMLLHNLLLEMLAQMKMIIKIKVLQKWRRCKNNNKGNNSLHSKNNRNYLDNNKNRCKLNKIKPGLNLQKMTCHHRNLLKEIHIGKVWKNLWVSNQEVVDQVVKRKIPGKMNTALNTKMSMMMRRVMVKCLKPIQNHNRH